VAFLAKPIVALGFGAFFFCGFLCTHFDEITTSPLPTAPDWVVGAFLLIGGFASRRDWTNGYAYQVAGWAAMASLLFGSVVGNFEAWRAEPLGADTGDIVSMSQGSYLAAVSLLFVLALGGLIASLRARSSRPPRGQMKT
jgi:hypothetical protein